MKIGSKKGAALRRAIGDLLLWLLLTACIAGALPGRRRGVDVDTLER
ncbi:hypothetical protein [uncultured Alistipes sp.]|nr:hypothetical protein [uncultured Alistipes sp.]